MCNLCTANTDLRTSLEAANGTNIEDIATPFALFQEFVATQVYDTNQNRNKEMKIKVLQVAKSLWEGYLPITKEEFLRKLDAFNLPDDQQEIRIGMKNALLEIFDLFGNRLPWAFYGGYMFMVTRQRLDVPERLPDLANQLPQDLPWECIDAVWHGLPPATDLYIFLMSIICKHIKRVPRHGCGCNHYLPPLPSGPMESITFIPIEPERFMEETEVPVAHFIVAIESLVRGLPHRLSFSSKKLRHHASKTETPEVTLHPIVTTG